jgi:glutamate 5-kinase
MPTIVVKLGSSVVAEATGDLRPGVLERICDEVAALHGAGVEVVIVTSGAGARGAGVI